MTQVVIDDIIPRTQLIATSGQTVFNTNWTADATTDILVYARADGVDANDVTQLVSSSDYNVTFIGASETVRVTFLVGRTLDDIISIVRDTPADRLNLYVNTNFTPSMLNQDFGILTLVDQQAQMYDYIVNPGYNVSAIIEPVVDTVLPILQENQIWAMNPTRTAIIAYDVPASGTLAPGDAKYILQQPNSDLPNAQSISALSSGIIVGTTTSGVLLSRILTGTTDQITITNGSGISGNPTFSIATNPILPGTGSFIPPSGTTAQRPGTPAEGMLRYNTDLNSLEVYEASGWDPLSGGIVDSITGTANQIIVDNTDPANPILSTPQDIAITSAVQFGTVQTPFLLDSNGANVLQLRTAASAVNWLTITNSSAGAPGLSIECFGADTNINFFILTKGTGAFVVDSFNTTTPMLINSGTGRQHSTYFAMANTAASRTVTFQDASGTMAYLSDIPAGSPSALTRTDDTNVTLTLGGTPATALLQATSLTLGWTGTLSGTRGGTGVNNGTSTITLGGSLTTSGAFASTFTMSGITTVTFPTSGTLATTSQLVTPAALTRTDDTNVTITLGGSPTTALVNAASLTMGWTGQLSLARGGSNANLTASNGGIVYSTAGALAVLAGTVTPGQMLQSGSSTTPAWSTSTYPATNAVNTLLYASSANVMAALATANNGVLITSAGGAPSISSILPSGIAATSMNLTTPTLGVAAATSINFGGSALSTYAELTTWTPVVTFATPGDVSVTYSEQTGYYSRVGNIVTAHFALATVVPTYTTASGNLRITGLPFTANANIGAIGSVQFQASTFPAGTSSLYIRVVKNTDYMIVGSSGSGVAAAFMTTSQCLTGVSIFIVGSITYLV